MTYLKQLEATAPDEKSKLVRRWVDSEPLPFFEELRNRRPILETPDFTLVSRYDDVVAVLSQPTAFTVELYVPKMGTFMLTQDDTPAHTRDKAVMQTMLNRDDVPRVREMIAEETRKILDAAGGRLEVVQNLSRKVPLQLVRDYFGFAGADLKQLSQWSYWNQYDAFHNQPFDYVDNAAEIHTRAQGALAEMKDFLVQLVRQRIQQLEQGATHDDILCRLLRTSYPASIGFPVERLVLNVGGLLIGAIETTSQATVHALAQLLARPDVAERAAKLAAEPDPGEFDDYVFEALRFHPISPYLFRRCAQDYVLARQTDRQVTIREGTTLLLLTQSAMFDPRAYYEPTEFQPGRPRANEFHFGYGLHECLGKHIALVMIPEMIRGLMLRPKLRAVSEIAYRETPFPQEFTVTWD